MPAPKHAPCNQAVVRADSRCSSRRRVARQPDQVRGCRISPGAELIQVAAGAEIRPVGARQPHSRARIGERSPRRLYEGVAHQPVHHVAPGRKASRMICSCPADPGHRDALGNGSGSRAGWAARHR